MKSFEKDIQKLAEKTRLKAMEREMVRERILAYMEYHPLRKADTPEDLRALVRHEDFFYIHLSTLRARLVGGFLVCALIVGIPLVAERTVPGDTLYLVKTGINETIRTQFATSPYAKVQLETRLIERRLAEARLLAEEGKLTEEVEAQIAETVKGHAVAVQNGIAELREDDAEGAAMAEIEFNSALEVQSVVLGETGEASTTQGDALKAVVDTVMNEVATDENPVAPSYDTLIARVESETTRSYELFESVKDSATPEEVADIERRLSDINRTIREAKEVHEDDVTGAVAELINVLGLTQKLITFMTDIDVREAVSLETLVPMKLTLEERMANVDTEMADLTKRVEALRVVDLGAYLPEAVKEKVLPSIDTALDIMNSISESRVSGDIVSEETLIGELRALVDDIEKLALAYVPVVPNDETEDGEAVSLPTDTIGTGTPTSTSPILPEDGEATTTTETEAQ